MAFVLAVWCVLCVFVGTTVVHATDLVLMQGIGLE